MISFRVSRRLLGGASTLALAAGVLAAPGAAMAASCSWNGGTADYSVASQWSCNAVPGSGDTVTITTAGSVVTITSEGESAGPTVLGKGDNVSLNNSTLNQYGGVLNDGTITVANNSRLQNQAGSLTYSGTGAIVLDDTANAAQIYNGSVTFGGGQTVSGSGQIGLNGTTFINNGVISASVAGRGIDLDVSGGNGGVTANTGVGTNGASGAYNTGTMQANGGTLSFGGGLYENSSTGLIQAINGGTVALNGDSRIVGGTLTSSGMGSTISAVSNNQYLQSVTLSTGSNLVLSNDNLFINTGITNNGTITVSNNSRLSSETATVTYGGVGKIVLDNSVSDAQIYGNTITFGSGQTVRGSGQIGLNGTVVTNNGLISADIKGGGIDIDVLGGNGGVSGAGVGTNANSGLLNNATMQATNGATLSFEGGLYENGANGVIKATDGGTVALNGDSRIVGGTLTSDSTSSFSALSTTQYLQSVTLSTGSNLTLNNDNLFINTGITNNGTITVTNNSRLSSETATVTYGGVGKIVLDNSVSDAQIYGNTITFGSGQTVRGSGQIGLNGTVVTNNGLISADIKGGGIDIDVSGGNGGLSGAGVGTNANSGLLNNATMQATNGATLSFEGGLYENGANGVIKATDGGTVDLNGDSRIVGGTLTSDSTSSFSALSTTQYLQSVTLSTNSNLTVNNDNLYITNTITNNGTISVFNSSALISETAAVTYGGKGTIVLDNSANVARIYGGTVTFGANQVVRGAGQIGINQTIIVNNGLISADAGSGIDIDAAGGNGGLGTGNGGVGADGVSSLQNNATMQAKSSTLAFEGGRYDNTNGLIQAIDKGTVALNGDSRIIGGTLTSDSTSSFSAVSTTQYLQSVTLSTGSNLTVNNDNLYINTAITNNGAVSVINNSSLISETAAVTYGGTGTITLDDTANIARIYGGTVTFGANQTVQGSGQIGINQTLIVNNGLISGNVNGRNLDIDPAGGNGGVGAGNGVGTNGNSALLNNGSIQATNGGTVTFEGGLYENAKNGQLLAGTGSTFAAGGDSSLLNLGTGGVLDLGQYISTTKGAQSTLNLQSNAASSIVTIGTAGTGTDTIVTLSGANSVLQAQAFSQGAATTIDNSLTTIAQTGELQLLNGRSFTAVGDFGTFTNLGQLQLSSGTSSGPSSFGAVRFTNYGTTFGNGTISVDIANSGTVNATGGTLKTQAITGLIGIISTAASGTLDIGGASSAAYLTNNGHLGLGADTITVAKDYYNASFGAGNAFTAHANVTGTGLINATSATMDLSGADYNGGTGTLNVGNVRIGGSSSTTLTVTNNGAATFLRGAVQNTNAPNLALTSADFVLAPNGGAHPTTISYTGTTAGSLSGQSLDVVNNFDNVADKTVKIAGNVYQIAVAGSVPTSITLAAARVGDTITTSSLTISNVAPNTPGFTESLSSTASTSSPFQVDGGTSSTTSNLTAGTSQSIKVGLSTATAGAFSSTVGVSNTSVPVSGSGFSNLALAGQSVGVSGNVYAPAVATLSSSTVNFGTVRQGTSGVTGSVGVKNTASGALTDALNTSLGTTPSNVTSTSTPGALAQGKSGTVGFALNTSSAGVVSGSTSLGFTSTDSQLSPLTLASQSVGFSGTVTQVAVADLILHSGPGTFSGSGDAYTLNLGTFTGSGSVTDVLGALNAIPNTTYGEALNGSFIGGTKTGFVFTGPAFNGLAGGQSTSDDLVFNYTGLKSGTYTDSITLDPYSSYAGLTNDTLSPITLDITAMVQGGVISGAPEPTTWAQLMVGVGLLGVFFRRRGRRLAQAAATA